MADVSVAIAEIEKNLGTWLATIKACESLDELDIMRRDLLGKSSHIVNAFSKLKELAVDDRRSYGDRINKVKASLEATVADTQNELEERLARERLREETVDVTLPVGSSRFGSVHPITGAMRRIRQYYQSRGFSVIDGPEIETDFFNFDALNVPKHHPARQSHDTFYVDGFEDVLLRTQTSCVQVRAMLGNSPLPYPPEPELMVRDTDRRSTVYSGVNEHSSTESTHQKGGYGEVGNGSSGIPIRMVSMGRTYRRDAIDATHSPMFHQLEGLVVDRTPRSIGHLKSELVKFISFFFGVSDVAVRFRPSFFPFVEPGMEFDCRYTKKDGRVVFSQSGDRWLEIGGAGMVHPNVFKSCGITGEVYGFAYAFGIERIIMLKEGISDIRNLYSTDHRLLRHYGLPS